MKCYYTLTVSSLVLFVSLMTQAVRTTTAFVVSTKGAVLPSSPATTTSRTNHNHQALFMAGSSSSTGGETEIEKLLRMARELRAQAEESEKEVVLQQADKKADRVTRLDGLLRHLFYSGNANDESSNINTLPIIVERLRSKEPSKDTLEKFTDWLDDRRDNALGNEHVEAKGDKFVSVSGEKNEKEADRLRSMIDGLLDALEVIDNDEMKSMKKDDGHLGGGQNSANLRQRLKEKRRVRDEQFLERQASFLEAQSIKKGVTKYEYNDEMLDKRTQDEKKQK